MIVTMQKTIANVSTGMLQMRLVLCAAGGQNAGDGDDENDFGAGAQVLTSTSVLGLGTCKAP